MDAIIDAVFRLLTLTIAIAFLGSWGALIGPFYLVGEISSSWRNRRHGNAAPGSRSRTLCLAGGNSHWLGEALRRIELCDTGMMAMEPREVWTSGLRRRPVDIAAGAQQNGAMSKIPTMSPEELRAIREELGLKQYEAPDIFGVALPTYKRWELGDSKIPGPAVLLARKYRDEHRKIKK